MVGFSASGTVSTSKTSEKGSHKLNRNTVDTTNRARTGGSSLTGTQGVTGTGKQSGQQTSSWGASPELMSRLAPFLQGVQGAFAGGGAGVPSFGSAVGQAQGAITEGGAEGVDRRMDGHEGGITPLLGSATQDVLGANNRDTTLRNYHLDDIQNRLNNQFAYAGRTGSAAHQGILARELDRGGREWEQDKFGRDIQAINTGNQTASTLQNLRLNPFERQAGIFQALASLGGQQTGNTQQQTANQQDTRSQQDQTNFENEMIKRIIDSIEKGSYQKESKTKSASVTAGFG